MVPNWRDKHTVFGAFLKGKLRINDFHVLISFGLCVLTLLIMGGVICVGYESLIGVTITVPFLHYGMAIFSLFRMINTDAPLAVWELVMFILAYIIHYGWGIAYLFIEWEVSEFKYDPTNPSRFGEYVISYLIVIPLITSLVSSALKFKDDKYKWTRMFTVQFSITVFQLVLLIGSSFVFYSNTIGIVVSIIFFFILYAVVQVTIYIRNENYLPILWQRINAVLGLIIIFGIMIFSFVYDGFNEFVGFSTSVLILGFGGVVYSLNEIVGDVTNFIKQPIFFSPWIFPVYRYNPKKNDVDKRNRPTVILMGSMLIILGWTILCSVWVAPFFVGISMSILIELILLTICLRLISVTAY